jgi:hypothetical protein
VRRTGGRPAGPSRAVLARVLRGLPFASVLVALAAAAAAAAPGAGPARAPAAVAAAPGAGPARAAQRLCLGAEALDPARPCAPGRATIRDPFAPGGNHPCRTVSGPAVTCRFGVAPARARRRIALVGDSHALHWRVALDVAARARRWSGVSITAPGCFFSAAVRVLPPGPRAICTDWYRAARRYLRRHPRITTVFTSSSSAEVVVVRPGQTMDAVKAAGFRRAYRALPRTVRRLVVIRDVPMNSSAQFACVRRAVAAGADANGACPLPRATALVPDAAVTAVGELRSGRYRSVDLTDWFCAGPSCLSVVGAVQVYKDGFGHITDLYASTLGRYLGRAAVKVL